MPKVLSSDSPSESSHSGRPRRQRQLPLRYRSGSGYLNTEWRLSPTPPASIEFVALSSSVGEGGLNGEGIHNEAETFNSQGRAPAESSVQNGADVPVASEQSNVTISGSQNIQHTAEPRAAQGDLIQRRQQLLLDKEAIITRLQGRIQRLERSERRLKRELVEGKDLVSNKDAQLGEVERALHIAEEQLQVKEETTRGLIRELHRYQGWWLNEYYCLKVALNLARNQNDPGVKAMRESSHARFMTWSGSHQP